MGEGFVCNPTNPNIKVIHTQKAVISFSTFGNVCLDPKVNSDLGDYILEQTYADNAVDDDNPRAGADCHEVARKFVRTEPDNVNYVVTIYGKMSNFCRRFGLRHLVNYLLILRVSYK